MRVTVLCTLLILLVLTGFSEILAVRAPNWRSDDKQEKQAKKDYYEVSDSFCKLAIFWAVITFSENFTVKAPKCHYDEKHPKKLCQNEDSER